MISSTVILVDFHVSGWFFTSQVIIGNNSPKVLLILLRYFVDVTQITHHYWDGLCKYHNMRTSLSKLTSLCPRFTYLCAPFFIHIYVNLQQFRGRWGRKYWHDHCRGAAQTESLRPRQRGDSPHPQGDNGQI